jgi:triacylglycerol lipase
MDEIAAFWLLFVVFQPFERLWMGREERLPPSPDATPVLLIPGYCCNRALWRSLRRKLRLAGRPVATVSLEPPFAGIDLLAEALALRIDWLLADTGARQVVLVGHSMGGLVARAYLWRRGAEHVAKLITIATPHHGTWLARLALGRNADEMAPGSGWLAALNSRDPGVPSHCFWSAGDEIVRPPDAARLAGAHETALTLPGHFTLLRAPEVLRAVLEQEAARTDARADSVHAESATSPSGFAGK